MGSSTSYPISPAQRAALAAIAAEDGFIRFDQFMALALYQPEEGYYRRQRTRVGRTASADFFTASSLGPVFGELVVASCVTLLRGRDPSRFTFYEYGAENGQGVLEGVEHPFGEQRIIGIDDPGTIDGCAIVFSNELFDAQPCRRFRRSETGWQECGVILTAAGVAAHERLVSSLRFELPPTAPLGYHLDWPVGATALATRIAQQPWMGLFMAFDYGKSWQELTTEVPQGTVRAYHRHRQKTALLEAMGEQDLTSHICWDHLTEVLRQHRFETDPILSQEAFLVKHAAPKLAEIMAAESRQLSARKAGLMQLLHPSALGQKFQVAAAWREES